MTTLPFKIVKQPRAWWPVAWPGVAEDGGIVDNRIELRMRLLKVDEAGQFIRDAMQGRPVVVKGDGRPCRSYLYASDLTAWLLAMLVKARPGAVYNVGSDQSVSIAELARRTSDLLGGDGVTILGAQDPGWNPGRYVPDTSLIRSELGVQQTQSLDEAILRTALWNGWEPKSLQTGMCLHARM